MHSSISKNKEVNELPRDISGLSPCSYFDWITCVEPRGAGTEAEPAEVYRTFPSTVGAKLAAQLACQRATRASCWEPCSDGPVVGNPAVMIMLPARGARRLRSQRATLAREGRTRLDLSAAVGRPYMTRKTSAPIRLSDFSDFRDWIARANSANIWQI